MGGAYAYDAIMYAVGDLCLYASCVNWTVFAPDYFIKLILDL